MSVKHKQLDDVQYKANLLLQILLLINVYVSAAWALIYAFHIFYNLSHLWDLHGIFVIIGYAAALMSEFWRLHEGYSGNLKAKSGDLSIFLIISPLIQMPILLFLLLMAKRQTTSWLLTVTTNFCFGLMLLEFVVGIFTWRKLSYQQTELYKLKRQNSMQIQSKLIETEREHFSSN